MASISRSGGLVGLYWHGKVPDPQSPAFADALREHRFRSIDSAASEEVSVGWVTPADPTGDHFAPEDLDGGPAAWLRLRIDKKVLPRPWLAIHRCVAEKARGRRLSGRERRELRDELEEQLLPRVLPTVGFVDALLMHERRLVLVLTTRKSALEAFGKLFFESFAVPLERADAYRRALALGLGEAAEGALERVEPVRWPSEHKDRERRARAATTATSIQGAEA
jgi:Putative exonuclease, RdgC